MFELLSKLSFTRGLNILFILFGSVAGPFCFLYRYYYDLYSHNDLTKILFLSAAIGVPVCLIMSFLNALMIGIPKLKEQDIKMEWELRIIGFTSGFCGFIFYSACFFDWIVLGGLKPRDGIELMLYTYAGAVSYSIIKVIRAKLVKKSKK